MDGNERPLIGELNGRHRLELRLGYFGQGGSTVLSNAGGVSQTVGVEHFSAGAGYSYWIRPDLALSLTASSLDSAVETGISRGVSSGLRSVASLLVGLRRDFPSSGGPARLRPYLSAALGPYFASEIVSRTGARGVANATRTTTAFGGQVGGGLDVQLSGLVMLGARAGYNFMTDFPSPVGSKVNYSGFEAGVSLSFLFGKGRGPLE